MAVKQWQVYHADGSFRIVVTKPLPGKEWLDILTRADCRVEVCTAKTVLSEADILSAIGDHCDGAIGQLNETWGRDLFFALKSAGGKAYSNYAVGFNNVDMDAATACGIPVGNTPGVLTETTAEMAVALTFAVARRVGESERFLREGRFKGMLPDLFLGELLWRKTLGIVGAGRIGAAYARMMVEGHKMNLIYYSPRENPSLEAAVRDYNKYLEAVGEKPVRVERAESLSALLTAADVVSLHTPLNESTRHLIDAGRLSRMKKNAILINTSRGPVVDEAALEAHCREHPQFKAGLDVFENEPELTPGLAGLDNVVIVPHIGSASRWTREGMAVLAARNLVAILKGYPVWTEQDVSPFLETDSPKAAPSIVNAGALNLTLYGA